MDPFDLLLQSSNQPVLDQPRIKDAAGELTRGFDQAGKSRQQWRELRASVEKLRQRNDLAADTRTAIDELQKELEGRHILPPLFTGGMLQDAADKAPEQLKNAAKGAADLVEQGAQGAVEGMNFLGVEGAKKLETIAPQAKDAVKQWREFTEKNPKTGLLIGGGVLAAAAAGVYLAVKTVFKAVKWVGRTIGQGLSWLWNNKWKVLTLGGIGYGMYRLSQNRSKAPAGAPATPSHAPGENLVGKTQQIEIAGRKHTVSIAPDATVTVDGRHWKLQGRGAASLATFSVRTVERDAHDNAVLEVTGKLLLFQKTARHRIPAAELRSLIAGLAAGTPPPPLKVENGRYEIELVRKT
ncbi:MAG: hypothetical protein Greene041619_656 [Candidatus Peregrinibacteria bacterium Greene0416_19]|nr:MAG: hypothetical protein Greene041619_656 [Candidatus Peregrinibacteria bacterium Greene0416_19]